MPLTIHTAATGEAVFSTTQPYPTYASTQNLIDARLSIEAGIYGRVFIGANRVDESDLVELLNALPRCGSWEARGVSDAERTDCDQPAHANGRCTAHGGMS